MSTNEQLRVVLADAIQAARSGTTGSPPNVDGLTTDDALDIMGHGLIEADNLLRAGETESAEREREQRIEQAAQVMSENVDRGVASMPWESMPDSIREQWRRNARALDAAGLLRGGGRGE